MNFLRTLRVNRLPLDTTKGVLIAGGRIIRCSLGRSGPSVFKREGDGATPAQRYFSPIAGFFRADRTRRPSSALAFDPIVARDGWCDDPTDANYNLPVDLPYGRSHEVMTRNDHLYDIGVILDWNMPVAGRKRFAGSAIFLHLCKSGYQATEGCIAIEEADMRWLLARINTQTRILVSR